MTCKGMPMPKKTVAEILKEREQHLLEMENSLRAAFEKTKASNADLAMSIASLGVMGFGGKKGPKV